MAKIMYYSQNSDREEIKNTEIVVSSSMREAILFFLNNQDTSGFIFDLQNKIEDNKKILLIMEKFNPSLPVIALCDVNVMDINSYYQWNKNFITADNLEDALLKLKPFLNKRKYYRIEWPLNITFADTYEMKNTKKGKILTLSLGGAYVQTEHRNNLKKNDRIVSRIEFSVFFLLVESIVVRVSTGNEKGFAVQFENISEATRKCLNRIINDEVIFTLSKELNYPL